MKTQRNKAKIPVVVCAVVGLLGLSLLLFPGGSGFSAEPGGSMDVAASAVAGPAVMFIKFDGIDGESTDKDHKAWSDLVSFGQGQQVSDVGVGGGGLVLGGSVLMEDVAVTKALDKASPKLAEAVCRGTRVPKVQIDVTRSFPAGNKTYYAYELKEVLIASYHVGGSAGSESLPLEQISLNFAEIKATYTEYDSAGTAKGSVTYSYKAKTGVKF